MDFDAALEATVSREEAYHEIKVKHNCPWREFVQEVGDKEEYKGSEILHWLGY